MKGDDGRAYPVYDYTTSSGFSAHARAPCSSWIVLCSIPNLWCNWAQTSCKNASPGAGRARWWD